MKDIALHILDIVENSVRAESTEISIEIKLDHKSDELVLFIEDNGKGMPVEIAENAHDPFYSSRTTRTIGMGLALLKQNSELTGGSFSLVSYPNSGTWVKAIFHTSNIDCIPIGDLAGTIAILMTSNPSIKINFSLKRSENQYYLDSFACKTILGEENFQHPTIIKNLKEIMQIEIEEILKEIEQ